MHRHLSFNRDIYGMILRSISGWFCGFYSFDWLLDDSWVSRPKRFLATEGPPAAVAGPAAEACGPGEELESML